MSICQDLTPFNWKGKKNASTLLNEPQYRYGALVK